MSASQKLKWKKLVKQLRYMYEEIDIIEEIATSTATEFQTYYENFSRNHNVDIAELNRRHADRIKEMYGVEDASVVKGLGAPPLSGSADVMSSQAENKKQLSLGGELDEDARAMHEIFSKLFKKLAVQLHPDKLANTNLTQQQKDEMLKMFTNAKEALEEKKYFVLIDYAEKLNIPLPKNYKQQVRWMKKELDIVRGTIGNKTRSYNYMFSECDTEQQKDILVRQFVYQLFGETIL